MKKLYTLIAGTLLFTTSAMAQRMIDLQATMQAPVAGATITSGGNLVVAATVTNTSTTAFKVTDTLLYGFTIDGTIVEFNGGVTTFFKTGKLLNQNDTFQINRTFSITFPAALNGPQEFCVITTVLNRSADSAKDNILTNNAGCATLNFSGGTTSINTVSASSNLNVVTGVYPVPATNQANFELKLNSNSDVAVKITDLMGRTVIAETKGMMSKGAHTVPVNTSTLANGIYLYQVIMNGEVASGRIVVSK